MVEDETTFPAVETLGCHRSVDVEPDRRLVTEYVALVSIHNACGWVVKVWMRDEPNVAALNVGAPGVPPPMTE